MATEWKYRCFIVSPELDKDPINSVISYQVDTNGGLYTLTIGLSANGEEPATHYWCCTSMTRSALELLLQLASNFPNSKAYIWMEYPDPGVDLEAMALGIENVFIGRVTSQEVLDDNGLSIVSSGEV